MRAKTEKTGGLIIPHGQVSDHLTSDKIQPGAQGWDDPLLNHQCKGMGPAWLGCSLFFFSPDDK